MIEIRGNKLKLSTDAGWQTLATYFGEGYTPKYYISSERSEEIIKNYAEEIERFFQHKIAEEKILSSVGEYLQVRPAKRNGDDFYNFIFDAMADAGWLVFDEIEYIDKQELSKCDIVLLKEENTGLMTICDDAPIAKAKLAANFIVSGLQGVTLRPKFKIIDTGRKPVCFTV